MEATANQTESKRHVFLKRFLILFGVLAIAGVVLVACGGGSFQPATGTITNISSAYEDINGITVPPEPAPTLNNSTIAGIDVNKNGVRDDVERMIAKKIPSVDQFTGWMIVAGVYQSTLLAATISQTEYETMDLKVTCVDYKYLDTMDTLTSGHVLKATLNTSLRKQDYKNKIAMMPGRFVSAERECRSETAQISEVINGITVPPEPDSDLNNSTLAGIDVNKNGVRDDVERVIAGASKKSTYDAQTLPIANQYNKLATSQFATPEGVADVLQKIYCLEVKRTPNERQTISAEDIKQLTNNTPERASNASANAILIATKPTLVEGGFSCP